MLELKDIGLERDSRILNGINVTFTKGGVYGIIGRSGVGKTSLLQISTGFLDPTEGEVLFKGERIIGPSVKLVPGYDDLQLVNQDFKLDLFHTVEQNIREKVLSRHESDQQGLIDEFLELTELGHLREVQARYISGGEQQRLALARALACEPEMIMLDEPFVHLDQRLRLKIQEYLKKENKERELTIALVSHDGAEMLGFVNEIIYLDGGEVKRHDVASKIYYTPQSKQEGQLLGLVNSLIINGKEVLFRPNEYTVSNDGALEVNFEKSIETGVVVINFFKTKENEEIVLYSPIVMNNVNAINISKRYDVA